MSDNVKQQSKWSGGEATDRSDMEQSVESYADDSDVQQAYSHGHAADSASRYPQ